MNLRDKVDKQAVAIQDLLYPILAEDAISKDCKVSLVQTVGIATITIQASEKYTLAFCRAMTKKLLVFFRKGDFIQVTWDYEGECIFKTVGHIGQENWPETYAESTGKKEGM